MDILILPAMFLLACCGLVITELVWRRDRAAKARQAEDARRVAAAPSEGAQAGKESAAPGPATRTVTAGRRGRRGRPRADRS